jgi:hypothetical protein
MNAEIGNKAAAVSFLGIYVLSFRYSAFRPTGLTGYRPSSRHPTELTYGYEGEVLARETRTLESVETLK